MPRSISHEPLLLSELKWSEIENLLLDDILIDDRGLETYRQVLLPLGRRKPPQLAHHRHGVELFEGHLRQGSFNH
ncbi:hypothetical protein MRX96_000432 [Rhipicephalus microplus]